MSAFTSSFHAAAIFMAAFLLSGSSFAAEPAARPATADDERALVIGRAYLRYQEQLRAAAPEAPSSAQWWRTPPASSPAGVREKLLQAQFDFHDAVREALGVEPLTSAERDSRFDYLPAGKRERIARIEQLHGERMTAFRRDIGSARVPADLEELRRFNADRERDLASVLTPAELEVLELRTSSTAMMLRQRYGELIESEEEFRKIFALQKEYEDKFSVEAMMLSVRPTDSFRLRSEAEHKLLEDIGAVVGEARAPAFRRALDQEFITLTALTRRLKLAPTVPEAALKIRESYAAQTMVINNEPGMDSRDRRALIQDLAKDARKEIVELLGQEVADAYIPRANWISRLESGTAFSTNPKDAPAGMSSSASMGIYSVLPAGVTLSPSSSSSTVRTRTTSASTPASKSPRPIKQPEASAQPEQPPAAPPAASTPKPE
jgi:hypothetical protein